MRNVEICAIIQFYINYIFITYLYLTNTFSVRERFYSEIFHLNLNFALALEPRGIRCTAVASREIEISISISRYNQVRNQERYAGWAIKRSKRRLSRLLRASPNILIPDSRNTRCGSFFKMLLVLRASVGHLHNLNRHLREVCAGFIQTICRWYHDSEQAIDRRQLISEGNHSLMHRSDRSRRRREI